MSFIGYAAALAAIWTMLWGSPTFANVVSGLILGVLLVIVIPGLTARRAFPVIRPLPLLRLVGYMAVSAVRSNVVLSREILTQRRNIHTTVTRVPMPGCSDELVALVGALLAITPGTLPLEVVDEPRELFVHILHLEPLEDARRGILRLTGLCIDAFGSDEARTRWRER